MTKADYTIALCDILGFSELVKGSPLDILVNNAFDWLSKALHHALYHRNFPDQHVPLEELQAHPDVGFAWFSDTLLLFTRRDEDVCLRSLLEFLSWILFESMFRPDVRLRCAVSYGEAFIDSDNSLFVGSPIVEAYHLERNQQWAGAALTEAAYQRVPEWARAGNLADWPVVPYPVPLKQGCTMQTLAIDWTWGIHAPLALPWSPSTPEPTAQDWKNLPGVCEKWRNTREFHRAVCQQCFSRKRPFTSIIYHSRAPAQ